MAILLGLIWRPAASPLHIFAAAAVLAALAIVVYARTMPDRPVRSLWLLMMRLGMISALAVLLMGPSRLPAQTQTRRSRPRLSILLDTSASMLTDDCDGGTRADYALRNWLSKDRLEKLARSYNLRLAGFDEKLSPLPVAALARPGGQLATGNASHIARCITNALLKVRSGSRDSAMLVISDGRDSGEMPFQPVALLGRARNVPIHAVCLGGPTHRRDVLLAALPKQEYLLADEPGEIIAKVVQVGLGEAAATLHVRTGSQERTWPIRFESNSSVTVNVPIQQDKAGLYEYKVWVDPVAGESETRNNTQMVFCEVTAQRIKVLLLEGEPFWDTKFLAQSLRKDGRVELAQVTQLSRRRQEEIVTRSDASGVQVPATAEDLARYDVVILGRGIEHLLDPKVVSLLPEFVSGRGGHVIFARGRAYDPETPAGRQVGRTLAVIEPVIWGRGLSRNLSLSLTPAGRSSPCFSFPGVTLDAAEAVSRLPGFTVMPAVQREKTATVVLARAAPGARAGAAAATAGPPAVVSMNYGRGKVVALLGEGLWRWSFLPPEMKAFDGLYDAFWSNLVRHLAMGSDFLPGQQVSLKLSRSSVRLGDAVVADVVCRFRPPQGFAPELEVIDAAGKVHRPALRRLAGMESRLQASFTPDSAGVYRAALAAAPLTPPRQEKKFSVYDVDLERLQASADPKALETLAEHSGGRFFRPEQAGEMAGELARRQAARVVPRQPSFVWDTAKLLLLLLGWAGLEWLLRRRAGMP